MESRPPLTRLPPGAPSGWQAWPAAAWLWLTAPAASVVEPGQRRQARLMASLLVVVMPLAALSELFIISILRGQVLYTGWIITAGAIVALAVAYVLSRTAYYAWAGVLIPLITAVTIFVHGAVIPGAVRVGFLNWLLVPLLLASAFLSLRQLLLFAFANLVGVVFFPLFVPAVSFQDIALASLSLFVLSAGVVLVLTRHRDQLEHDRAASLRQAEARAHQETARTAVLLRVAERLNALMDLEALLATMCEETERALGAQAALVFLYDEAQAVLSPAASHGLPAGRPWPAAIPRAVHDQLVSTLGPVAAVPPGWALDGFPSAADIAGPLAGSLTYANLAYEGGLVGLLFVIGPAALELVTGDERLILRGLADQAALAIVNTRLYKDSRQRLERLQALRTIDIAISSNVDLPATLNVVLEQITAQLGVDAALVLLLDTDQQRLVYAAERGFRTQALRATRLRLGDGYAGQVALQRRILAVPDLAANLGTFAYAPLLSEEGFVSYFAAPLVAKDEVRGVLEIFHRAPLRPDAEWLAFLEALAGQAAIALDNTTLLSDLQRSNAELSLAYDATIEGWSHALDLRDKETEGHTLRVTELTLALARRMGAFDAAGLVHVRRGALLHDIGKMGVPDSILLKPGPLTDAEWVVMRRHPVYAYEMLRPIDYLRPAIDIPYAHHEKWDGSGYPRGLSGEQIPLAARLFAVVDIWDALRSDRPYRPAWPEARVRAHLADLAGTHLDPTFVKAFFDLLNG